MTIFNTYARRVKHYIADSFHAVEPSTCAQLSQLDEGLLPSLVSIVITFRGDPSPHLGLMPYYLRSNMISSFRCELTDRIHGRSLGSCVSAFLKSSSSQKLHCLALRGALSQAYSPSLSAFHSLRSVTLWLSSESWTYDVIHALSSLPQLVDVHFTFDLSDSIPKVALAHTAFSTLTSLSLAGKIPWIYYILDSITGVRLESITINHYSCVYNHTNALDHARLYRSLSRFTLLRSFKQLIENWAKDTFQPCVDSASIVQSFLGFAYLEHLQVSILQQWFQITDADISALAAACPSLKVLRLIIIPSPFTPLPPLQPTPFALCAIAKECPHLTDLSITLVSMDMQTLLSLPVPKKPSPLQNLDLQNTMIQNPQVISRFLDSLFPVLKSVTAWGSKIIQISDIIFGICQPVRDIQRIRDFEDMKALIVTFKSTP